MKTIWKFVDFIADDLVVFVVFVVVATYSFNKHNYPFAALFGVLCIFQRITISEKHVERALKKMEGPWKKDSAL